MPQERAKSDHKRLSTNFQEFEAPPGTCRPSARGAHLPLDPLYSAYASTNSNFNRVKTRFPLPAPARERKARPAGAKKKRGASCTEPWKRETASGLVQKPVICDLEKTVFNGSALHVLHVRLVWRLVSCCPGASKMGARRAQQSTLLEARAPSNSSL